jgi:hypothetical protein
LRRRAVHVAVICWRISPRPSLKKCGPAPGPCLPLSGIFRLGQHNQCARQFIGAEAICPGGDDQFTELAHFADFQSACLVFECLQVSIKVPWFAHRRLHECGWRNDSWATGALL